MSSDEPLSSSICKAMSLAGSSTTPDRPGLGETSKNPPNARNASPATAPLQEVLHSRRCNNGQPSPQSSSSSTRKEQSNIDEYPSRNGLIPVVVEVPSNGCVAGPTANQAIRPKNVGQIVAIHKPRSDLYNQCVEIRAKALERAIIASPAKPRYLKPTTHIGQHRFRSVRQTPRPIWPLITQTRQPLKINSFMSNNQSRGQMFRKLQT